MPITDFQSINDEFHKAFQKIYSQQEVEDNSEAKQEFLDSCGDTKPPRIPQTQSKEIEGEITLSELQYALFKKMKGSSTPGIDGFTVNWLRNSGRASNW